MTIGSSSIILDQMRFYSYHGVAPQETLAGAWYQVTLEVCADLSQAISTDALEGTIDYSEMALIVRKEMSVPSKLLEHAAGRIGNSIMESYPAIEWVTVTLTKENPPICCPCQGSSVKITFKR